MSSIFKSAGARGLGADRRWEPLISG